MPLIKHFKSTNVWNAFALNSLASSLTILIAIILKQNFDTYKKKYTPAEGLFLTLIFTFITSFLAYAILHFVFGFGGGMLTNYP